MVKSQNLCMKCLPLECPDDLPNRFRQRRAAGRTRPAVKGIADQTMTLPGQVNSNLMSAACLQAATNLRY